MHFRLCVLSFALATGAVATHPDDGICTEGKMIATYDDLAAAPINTNPIGLDAGGFGPYYGLNYTRFTPINDRISPQIVYVLSKLSAPPISGLLDLINALALAPTLYPRPSILGATDRTTFRMEKLDLFCGIRDLGATNTLPDGLPVSEPVPFPCYVKIWSESGAVAVCSFTGAASTSETCSINLPVGKKYTFQTFGNVTSLLALGQLQSKLANLVAGLDSLTELFLFTTMDNVTYTEYCQH